MLKVVISHRDDTDSDFQRLVLAAQHDAAQRADIPVVPAPGDGHVPPIGQHVVGGIEVYPPELRVADGQPGVRRVGAHEPGLPGGGSVSRYPLT